MISNSTITSVSLCGSEQQIYLLKEKVIESDKSWLSIEMEKIEEKVAILELETLRCNNIVLPPPSPPQKRNASAYRAGRTSKRGEATGGERGSRWVWPRSHTPI